MSRSCLCHFVPWLGSIGLMASWAGPTQAQFADSYSPSPSSSSARMSSSSFSGAGSYFGGSSTYVPFGGAMGGFVPYSSGLGGGLGVMPGMRDSGVQMPPGGLRMLGSTSSLGVIRSTTMPLSPLGLMNTGGRGRPVMSGDTDPTHAIRRDDGGKGTPAGGELPVPEPAQLARPRHHLAVHVDVRATASSKPMFDTRVFFRDHRDRKDASYLMRKRL